MLDVIVADDVYRKSKLPAMILERIRRKIMESEQRGWPTKAKKQWVETIQDEGTWYVVPLKIEMPGEKVVIISSPYPTKVKKVRRCKRRNWNGPRSKRM
jgi:hypothetical protein